MIKHFKDLEVYNLSYEIALEIYHLTKSFPKEEYYTLTNQLLRSSRSIPSNISEGWSKRKYSNIFRRHLIDAAGSLDETKTWIDFAKDFNYIAKEIHCELINRYEIIGKKLHNLHSNWHNI